MFDILLDNPKELVFAELYKQRRNQLKEGLTFTANKTHTFRSIQTLFPVLTMNHRIMEHCLQGRNDDFKVYETFLYYENDIFNLTHNGVVKKVGASSFPYQAVKVMPGDKIKLELIKEDNYRRHDIENTIERYAKDFDETLKERLNTLKSHFPNYTRNEQNIILKSIFKKLTTYKINKLSSSEKNQLILSAKLEDLPFLTLDGIRSFFYWTRVPERYSFKKVKHYDKMVYKLGKNA